MFCTCERLYVRVWESHSLQQGDQMSLWKNRPKWSPTHFMSKFGTKAVHQTLLGKTSLVEPSFMGFSWKVVRWNVVGWNVARWNSNRWNSVRWNGVWWIDIRSTQNL
jgi:hypothetical protein